MYTNLLAIIINEQTQKLNKISPKDIKSNPKNNLNENKEELKLSKNIKTPPKIIKF